MFVPCPWPVRHVNPSQHWHGHVIPTFVPMAPTVLIARHYYMSAHRTSCLLPVSPCLVTPALLLLDSLVHQACSSYTICLRQCPWPSSRLPFFVRPICLPLAHRHLLVRHTTCLPQCPPMPVFKSPFSSPPLLVRHYPRQANPAPLPSLPRLLLPTVLLRNLKKVRPYLPVYYLRIPSRQLLLRVTTDPLPSPGRCSAQPVSPATYPSYSPAPLFFLPVCTTFHKLVLLLCLSLPII